MFGVEFKFLCHAFLANEIKKIIYRMHGLLLILSELLKVDVDTMRFIYYCCIIEF
jgi:hypothetical protein